MTARPGLAEVRAWLDVPALDLPDDQLTLILEAEAEVQAQFCDLKPRRGHPRDDGDGDEPEEPEEPFWPEEEDEFPYPLAQALLRRCARAAAARGLPLGTLPVQMTGAGGEYGAALLPRLDAEIERYEAAYRIIAVA